MPIRSDVAGLRLARGRVQDVALVSDDGALTFGDLPTESTHDGRAGIVAAARDDRGRQCRRADRHVPRGARGRPSGALRRRRPQHVTGTATPSSRASTPTSSRRDDGVWGLDERRDGTRHELHPDLAMLASTSGSTGSPKLVRLSRENLLSNAVAIGDYLNLGAADRAITTLPMHYCYGLSVVNSHLVAGASIRSPSARSSRTTSGASSREAGATSFAGVPYTFDLLDATRLRRARPADPAVHHPGGRPTRPRARAAIRRGSGRDRGFDFVVMYGADRGDGTHGLPAARRSPRARQARSASRSRVVASGSTRSPPRASANSSTRARTS